jgi:hypothetical protein
VIDTFVPQSAHMRTICVWCIWFSYASVFAPSVIPALCSLRVPKTFVTPESMDTLLSFISNPAASCRSSASLGPGGCPRLLTRKCFCQFSSPLTLTKRSRIFRQLTRKFKEIYLTVFIVPSTSAQSMCTELQRPRRKKMKVSMYCWLGRFVGKLYNIVWRTIHLIIARNISFSRYYWNRTRTLDSSCHKLL